MKSTEKLRTGKPEPKPLFLVIDRENFNEILSGEKTEEYRDLSQHNISRICTTKDGKITGFRNFKTLKLQEGYHKGARQMIVEITGLTINGCIIIELGQILEVNFDRTKESPKPRKPPKKPKKQPNGVKMTDGIYYHYKPD